MSLKDEFVRRVGQDIAETLIRRVKLKTRGGEVQLGRFRTDQKEVYLGGEEDFKEIQERIVESVAEAIRTKAGIVRQVPSIEELEVIIRESISDQLSKLEGLKAGQVTHVLEGTFAERPSLLDRIAVAALPPFKEDQLQQLEKDLERCIIKVIDYNEGGREIISTAFVLCDQGHILTPAHVALRQGRSLTLECRGQDPIRRAAQVRFINYDWDTAILEVEEGGGWEEFQRAGVKPSTLGLQDADRMRGDPVICLGYQEQHIFLDPIWANGWVSPHYPLRRVRFRDGHEQTCLVFVMGEAHVVEGMSGGPVLNLNTREVVAMVTGATRRVFQKWESIWEDTSSAVYGFAVPLRKVADIAEKCWPEISRCCFAEFQRLER